MCDFVHDVSQEISVVFIIVRWLVLLLSYETHKEIDMHPNMYHTQSKRDSIYEIKWRQDSMRFNVSLFGFKGLTTVIYHHCMYKKHTYVYIV